MAVLKSFKVRRTNYPEISKIRNSQGPDNSEFSMLYCIMKQYTSLCIPFTYADIDFRNKF